MTGPNADWDDIRLDAAYQARFVARPPSGLIDRIAGELEPREAIGWMATLRRSAIGLAAAVVIVAVLVIAPGILISGHAPRTGSAPTPSTPDYSSPPIGAGPPFPENVVATRTGEALPVYSVREAVFFRDAGVDAREMAVGGWYASLPVPCPLWLGPVNRLDTCGLEFTWLMAAPEQLSVTDPTGAGSIHQPTGPAFNPVTDWRPADTSTPQPVVFIGHFDDPADAACAPARFQACADRFVVDQVAWNDQQLEAGFPIGIDGLTVTTVTAAINTTASGADVELAVAGWYQAPIAPLFCPSIPAGTISLGDCSVGVTWLLANPESTIFVGATPPRGGTVHEAVMGPPTGPAVHPVFLGPTPPTPNPLPAVGGSTPLKVVFIGHFNDRRAELCSLDDYRTCRQRFVVDSVAWVEGVQQPWPANIDLRSPGGPAESASQVDASIAFLEGHAWVLNTIKIPGSMIGTLEPALAQRLPAASSPLILSGDPVLWLATVVERIPATGEPVARTYVIDSSGTVYVAAASSFIQPGPEPTPS